MTPLRAGVFLLNSIAWFSITPPPGSSPRVAIAIIILSAVYVAFDALLVFRLPALAGRYPWGSTMVDFLFIVSWIGATGGASSPFHQLVFLGAVASALRLPLRPSLALTFAYAGSLLFFVGWSHWFEAAYVFAGGATLSFWCALAYRDRRNSLRDDLTGTFSREYANFRLNDVFTRGVFPVAVAVIDLDGFKQINDAYGHAAGDAVLVQAVRKIAGAIRQGDLLARTGGDEFLLVLPQANAEVARLIAERVRTGIELNRFRWRRDLPAVRLTTSVGIAIAEDASVDRTALIDRADACLYAAKEAGRNRVMM